MNRTMIPELEQLATESAGADGFKLDQMSPLEIVTAMNRADREIPYAIEPHLNQIARVAEWGIESIRRGGRIFYMGAGTSGRLGVLDAAECPPTFGVSFDTVFGLIAGGDKAFIKAAEGAEDSRELGKQDLTDHNLRENDLVIGLAASGRTPYVLGGLEYAGSIGCHTAAISCNRNSLIGQAAELAIDIETGPEILTGSTRLKAGTAQKMVLNMISTSVMAGLGKVYGNLMVDVVQTNAKLKARALRIVMTATGAEAETAEKALEEADGSCKTAILMILADCSGAEAESRLKESDGFVRRALAEERKETGSDRDDC